MTADKRRPTRLLHTDGHEFALFFSFFFRLAFPLVFVVALVSSTPTSDSTAAPAPSTARPAPRKHRRLAWLTGVVSVTLLVLNTLLSVVPIVPLALVKLAFPTPAVRRRVDPWLNAIATGWISRNTGWITRLQPDIWDIEINTELKPDDWYLVSCNHQSWVDIFVLQRVLNKRIPLLKFFLKQTLLYVPVIGLAWWALDFPFLKRYSKAKLRRNPRWPIAIVKSRSAPAKNSSSCRPASWCLPKAPAIPMQSAWRRRRRIATCSNPGPVRWRPR